MTCPNCKKENTERRYCTHCGIVFRKEILKRAAPKPKPGKVATMRLTGLLIGLVLGAVLAYFSIGHSHRWASYQGLGTAFFAVVGGAAGYTLFGVRTVIQGNRYKAKIGSLEKQLRHLMEGIEAGIKSGDPKKPEPSKARALATIQLILDEVDKSLHGFQRLRDSGQDDWAVYNNSGVALMKSGRLQNALEMFAQAEKKAESAVEPHSNLAHAFQLALVGNEDESLERAMQQVMVSLELEKDDAAHHNRRGLILCKAGRFDEAQQAFQRALSLSEGNRMAQADVHNDLGIAHYLKGDIKEAMSEFQQAVRLDPGHGRALANQGVVMVQSDTTAEGLAILQKAAELDYRSASVHANLGFAYLKSGLYNPGILALRKAVQLDPGNFEALYNLGRAYADNEIYDMASRYMQRALHISPNSWPALVAMAVININLDEYSEARVHMDKAIAKAPQDVDVYTVMGVTLALTFDFAEGERYLRAALAMDKESAKAYGQLAWLHFQQQNVSLGSEELSIALGKDEKNPILNDNYGLSQIELGSQDAALTYFRRALQFKPDFHRVHYHIGYVLAIRKKVEEAIPEWEIACRYESKDANVHGNLGVAYYRFDRLDDAVSSFRRALAIRQDRMEDYSNLALAYARQGVLLRKSSRRTGDYRDKQSKEKFGQAVAMFDRALEMSPDNVVLHSNRGLACFFANRLEDALHEWTQVSRLDPEYAKKRGELSVNTVFDDTALGYFTLFAWDRASMIPLAAPPYQSEFAPGYDTEEWDLVIQDEDLRKAPELSREAQRTERILRSLTI